MHGNPNGIGIMDVDVDVDEFSIRLEGYRVKIGLRKRTCKDFRLGIKTRY